MVVKILTSMGIGFFIWFGITGLLTNNFDILQWNIFVKLGFLFLGWITSVYFYDMFKET